MPEALVALVERLRVAALEALKASRELGLRAVQDEVVVRRHQAEGVQRPPVPLDARPNVCQKGAPIAVVPEDRAAVDSAGGDVEVAIGKRGAQDTGHAMHESARRPRTPRAK
jgi:hypothetical protein